METSEINVFIQHYIVALLWAETDDNGNPLDGKYSREDISSEAMASIIEDCQKFVKTNAELLKDINPEQAGHDFWLTRAGHGAGFWDRGLGKVGDDLTTACKAFDDASPLVGDDGKIYLL